VALSDQDDVWLPEKLRLEYDVLEKYSKVGIVFCDLKLVDENLNEIEKINVGVSQLGNEWLYKRSRLF